MLKKIIPLFFFLSIVTSIIQANYKDLKENAIVYSPTKCYTITKTLGEGAFAKVFEVVDSQGQYFALKAYRPYKFSDNSFFILSPLANPEREFLRGQTFDHPNIIKSIEVFSTDDDIEGKKSTFLLMELVKGKAVGNIKKKSLSRDEICQLTLQFVDAVRYAFSFGYLYLDMHEQNLLVSDDLNLKIVDLASFFALDELVKFIQKSEKEEQEERIFDEVREKKLNQFFSKNPILLDRLRDKAHSSKHDEISKENKAALFSYYLDTITEFCIKILQKSNLDRGDKIGKYINLKTISWECLEDYNDGDFGSTDDYFDRLSALIQQF